MHIATFDEVCQVLGTKPDADEIAGMRGFGWFTLLDEDGALKELAIFKNVITDYGDLYYANRAVLDAGRPDIVTGMKVGTGTTAPGKGTGNVIGTYVTAISASQPLDGGFPTVTAGSTGTGVTVQYKTTWAAGEATQNGLAEVALSNQTSLADNAGLTTNTIARALLSPVVNKGASDTLAITWNHVLLGAAL